MPSTAIGKGANSTNCLANAVFSLMCARTMKIMVSDDVMRSVIVPLSERVVSCMELAE